MHALGAPHSQHCLGWSWNKHLALLARRQLMQLMCEGWLLAGPAPAYRRTEVRHRWRAGLRAVSSVPRTRTRAGSRQAYA